MARPVKGIWVGHCCPYYPPPPPQIASTLATDNNIPSSHILPCGALRGERRLVGGQIVSISRDKECYERTVFNNASFFWLQI